MVQNAILTWGWNIINPFVRRRRTWLTLAFDCCAYVTIDFECMLLKVPLSRIVQYDWLSVVRIMDSDWMIAVLLLPKPSNFSIQWMLGENRRNRRQKTKVCKTKWSQQCELQHVFTKFNKAYCEIIAIDIWFSLTLFLEQAQMIKTVIPIPWHNNILSLILFSLSFSFFETTVCVCGDLVCFQWMF